MQYNIFQNDFYEDRPGVPWAYKVTVYAGMLQIPILVLSKGVKEVNLPDMELMTFRVHYGGRAFDIPTRYRNSSTFTMKFSERNDLLAYRALASVFSRTYDYDSSYSNLSSDLRIKVEILDPQNLTQKDTQLDYDIAAIGKGREETKNLGLKTNDADAVEIYEFKGCFIDKIDDLELDYSSEEIVEWGVTIQFNEVKVTYPHQAKITLADDVDRSESVDVPKKSKDSIHYTNPEEIRTEKQLMGTGSGEGGGGTGGGGAGNPDGRPGADGGLSATGNKDVNRHGNSTEGVDLHNDNTGESPKSAVASPDTTPSPTTEKEVIIPSDIDQKDGADSTIAKEFETRGEAEVEGWGNLSNAEKLDIIKIWNENGGEAEVGMITNKLAAEFRNVVEGNEEYKDVAAYLRTEGYSEEDIASGLRAALEDAGYSDVDIDRTISDLEMKSKLEDSNFRFDEDSVNTAHKNRTVHKGNPDDAVERNLVKVRE